MTEPRFYSRWATSDEVADRCDCRRMRRRVQRVRESRRQSRSGLVSVSQPSATQTTLLCCVLVGCELLRKKEKSSFRTRRDYGAAVAGRSEERRAAGGETRTRRRRATRERAVVGAFDSRRARGREERAAEAPSLSAAGGAGVSPLVSACVLAVDLAPSLRWNGNVDRPSSTSSCCSQSHRLATPRYAENHFLSFLFQPNPFSSHCSSDRSRRTAKLARIFEDETLLLDDRYTRQYAPTSHHHTHAHTLSLSPTSPCPRPK